MEGDKMTKEDKARIMSTQAKKPENQGQTKKDSFASRTQSAADKGNTQKQWTCANNMCYVLT